MKTAQNDANQVSTTKPSTTKEERKERLTLSTDLKAGLICKFGTYYYW